MEKELVCFKKTGGGIYNNVLANFKLDSDSKILLYVRYSGEADILMDAVVGGRYLHCYKNLFVYTCANDAGVTGKEVCSNRCLDRFMHVKDVLGENASVSYLDDVNDGMHFDLCVMNPPHENYGEHFVKCYGVCDRIAATLPYNFLIAKNSNKSNQRNFIRDNVKNGIVEIVRNPSVYFEKRLQNDICVFGFTKHNDFKGIAVDGVKYNSLSEYNPVCHDIFSLKNKLEINESESVATILRTVEGSTERLWKEIEIDCDNENKYCVSAPSRVVDKVNNQYLQLHGSKINAENELGEKNYKSIVFKAGELACDYVGKKVVRKRHDSHVAVFDTKDEAINYVNFTRGDYARLVCAIYNTNGHTRDVYRHLRKIDFKNKDEVKDSYLFKMLGFSADDVKLVYKHLKNIYKVDRNQVLAELNGLGTNDNFNSGINRTAKPLF